MNCIFSAVKLYLKREKIPTKHDISNPVIWRMYTDVGIHYFGIMKQKNE
jgi:hypothetical protein